MRLGKRFLGVLAGFVGGALLVVVFALNKVLNSRRRILKRVDAFAEPVEERVNEFIDSVIVKFDEVKEAVSGYFEQKRTKTVESDRNIKTTPG